MHDILRKSLILFLVFVSFEVCAQQLHFSWKRPVLPQDFLYGGYHLFQVLDFYVEKPLKNPKLSVGLEVVYADYHTGLKNTYQHLGKRGDFYERSFSTGLIGRYYTKPRVWRFYLEGGIHGNFLHSRQPVVINYYYGTYERIHDNRQFVMSATIAVGFSLGNNRLRYEPYFQYGVIGDIEKMKDGEYLTGSVGKVKPNQGIIICPVAIKVALGKVRK